MKAAVKWLHRWLGLLLGLVLAVVSLSGSWLIYDRELAAPDYALSSAPATLPLQALYERAMQALPEGSKVMLRFPQQAGQPYQFWSIGAEQQRVVIDPYSGDILALHAPDHWPYGWMFELHTALLAGERGEWLLGWLGVGFLVMTVLGIVLWWPRNWRSAWRLRLSGNRFLRHYDLHRQCGLLAAPCLLLALITGISLNFSDAFGPFLDRFSNAAAHSAPVIEPAAHSSAAASLDTLAWAANTALPGGRVGIITLNGLGQPVVVRKQLPDDPHPNGLNFIYLHPATAKVLKVVPLADAGASRNYFNWAYPLHTGQALQPWHHWLLLACGLLPPALLFTGLTLYLLRRRATRSKPLTR